MDTNKFSNRHIGVTTDDDKAAMLKAENPLEYDYSSGWSAAELMDKEVQHG